MVVSARSCESSELKHCSRKCFETNAPGANQRRLFRTARNCGARWSRNRTRLLRKRVRKQRLRRPVLLRSPGPGCNTAAAARGSRDRRVSCTSSRWRFDCVEKLIGGRRSCGLAASCARVSPVAAVGRKRMRLLIVKELQPMLQGRRNSVALPPAWNTRPPTAGSYREAEAAPAGCRHAAPKAHVRHGVAADTAPGTRYRGCRLVPA